MAQLLDFGNGVIAGGSATDAVCIKGHSGLEYPALEVRGAENAVLDGGTIGSTRAGMRRMSVALDFKTMTRRQIAAAFSPGVERVLSSPDARSIPYFIERVGFEHENLTTRPVSCALTLLASGAYFQGGVTTVSSPPGYTNITTGTTAGTQDIGVPSGLNGLCRVWQTFTVGPSSGEIGLIQFYLHHYGASTTTVSLCPLVAGLPDFDNPLRSASDSFSGFGQGYYHRCAGVTAVAAGVYAAVIEYDGAYAYPVYRADGTVYANGKGGYVDVVGDPVDGNSSGGDTTIDWTTIIGVAQAATTLTSTEIASLSDVDCPAVFTIGVGSPASAVTLSDGTRTATLTGAFSANDVVVIDTDNHTVTVNGTNRIAWFDTSGGWPILGRGNTTLSLTPASSLSVQWRPRYLGIL